MLKIIHVKYEIFLRFIRSAKFVIVDGYNMDECLERS